MTAVPAPSITLHREEWTDDDFDIPEGHPITTSDADSDKDEDWDAEMNLGQTGGARVDFGMPAAPQTSSLTLGAKSGFIPFAALAATVSAPLPCAPPSQRISDDELDEDEGVSTIKLSYGPTVVGSPRTPQRLSQSLMEHDDDLEDDFALPSDLSQLSLRPLEPHHPSKAILEWGDKEHTSSTYSSDAYSNLGLGIGASPSSFGTSASQPETETEDDDDEGILDGLVVPAGLFETGKGGKELARLIELRKNMPVVDERVRIASPEEDDFELGLLIEDDVDLSPSRLLNTQKKQSTLTRPKNVPVRAAARPPSRLRNELGTQHNARAQIIDISTRRNTRSPTFGRPRPPSRGQNSTPPVSLKRSEAQLVAASSSHHMPRSHTSVGLRSQKSHGMLNPPPGPPRASLARKASLSTLLDRNTEPSNAASSSGAIATRGGHLAAPPLPKSASSMALNHRYDNSTAASRARTQPVYFQTSSRIHSPEFRVPPTRPSTPSSNPAALRLTMPTASSRLKSRPSVSSTFSPTTPNSAAGPSTTPQSATSPRGSTLSLPHGSPPSAAKRPLRAQPSLGVARPLRKPKRAKVYGDGTELDKFEDLPTDREKERKYRVPPKSATALLPAPPPLRTSPSSGAIGKRGGRERGGSVSGSEPSKSSTSTLRRVPPARISNSPSRATRTGTVTNLGNRKPTLIRNLGGSNAPKVVGDMKWNPSTLRWEGNEQALRDFDATVGTSTRPALITHFSGSSIGSPIGSFAGGARVVGNMIFDPTRMCWISRLPPEEEEPDVFADMADDEDDGFEEGRGGTIRINQLSTSFPQTPSTRTSIRGDTPSPAASSRHSRGFSDISDGEYLGHSLSAPELGGINQQLIEAARAAEARHRAEMKGWVAPPLAPVRPPSPQDLNNVDPDRDHLWFIRAVATKTYEACDHEKL
ncbi:hypothetical protein BKA62DRAFT_767674 [Auriculariales sp. MPI-PUGE-AT-0066]|nr:hypothetical protein BKA62DRAFT_767674 [Auriculariales sp. MPI-PUGE-AT-0066]